MKPLVSVMASLQNSVPVQATAPRQKDEPSTCRPMLVQFARQLGGLVVGDVDEEQVLRDGGAQRAAAKALGKVGRGFKLLAGEAAAQHGCANVAQAGLALRMNAGVVAERCRRARARARRAEA